MQQRLLSYFGLLFYAFLLVPSIPVAMAGNGVSTTASSGVGSTDSITNSYSTVNNIGYGFDSSSSTYTLLLADGDTSGSFGTFCSSQTTKAYAEVLYTLSIQSSSNQSLNMSAYSETEQDGPSWTTVPSLKMTANITDNSGTWNAWTSTSTNNSGTPSPSNIDLGQFTPRNNGTIDVLVRIEHQGVYKSSCEAQLRVYDFFTDALPAPNIAYSGSPFTFTKNTTITTLTPTNTGGASTSWSVTSGTLPQGLSLNPTTGAITGTPTAVYSTASVTIEATNAAGSDTATISVTVQDEAPNIAYSGSPFTFTKNTTITTLTPTNTGGASTSWSVTSGTLPQGLSLNPTTGAITGTPTAVYSTASVTIEATNAAGSDTATISVTVQDEAPNIAYSGSPFTFTKNTTITTLTPTNTGGASTSWSVTSGTLPQGLSLNPTTGAITGTPTAVYSTASVTIEATNAAGSDTATISVTVQDEAPNIAYSGSPFTFTKNTTITTLTPTNTGGASTSWSVTSGTLPQGLSLNPTTGAITGTPTAVYSTASVTIEATNAAGSDTATISVTVQDEAPNIAYSGSPFTFTKNTTITTLTPTNTGGASTSWSVTSGTLPQGLSLNPTTGAITGTPTAVYSTASVTIEATNAAGSDTATISVTVQDEAPNIAYSGSPFTFTKNTTITTLTPTNTGGASTSWSVTSGTLPQGLSLNPTTGAITGTPTAVYSTASVTIEATNAAGSDTATISVTVQDERPSDAGGEASDEDQDGVADVQDDCPETPIGVLVDLSGCATSESMVSDKDDGSTLVERLRLPVFLIFFAFLSGGLLARQRDELEVRPFTEEFEELVRSVQGSVEPGEVKLVEENLSFDSFLKTLTETFARKEKPAYTIVRNLASIMRNEVFRPKGAVVYLRAMSTLLLRDYQNSINTLEPHKRFKTEKHDGKGISGKVILNVLGWSGKKPKWVKNLGRNHGLHIDNILMKTLAGLYEKWNIVIHPEDEIVSYQEQELETGIASIDSLVEVVLEAEEAVDSSLLKVKQ